MPLKIAGASQGNQGTEIMRIIFSILTSIFLTIFTGYLFFYPPDTPPNYVYLIVFIFFFCLCYALGLPLKRRKKNGKKNTE